MGVARWGDMHDGRVGLVMIARDEERCVQRALSSCRDFVDEMVLVDTGSRDGTQDLARAVGARVIDFEWCDDFAAARNFGLAASTCQWRLMLDADEWVSSGVDDLLAWCADSDGGAAAIEVRSYFEVGEGVESSVEHIIRLLPPAARFEGMVHERPVNFDSVSMVPLVVEHDGYLTDQAQKKVGRNERLLRRMLASIETPLLHFQLGKDLEVQERYAEAADAFDRALDSMAGGESWRHPLLARAIHCYGRCGRFGEGVALYRSAAAEWPHSPDIHFAGGDILLNCAVAHPHLAQELIPLARAAWERCVAIGERPDLEGAVTGRGSYLAARNLAVLEAWPRRPVGL